VSKRRSPYEVYSPFFEKGARRAVLPKGGRERPATPVGHRKEQKKLSAPPGWSDTAANLARSVFLCERGQSQSIRGLVRRIAQSLGRTAVGSGYLSSAVRPVFEEELEFLLIDQRAAFSSPVWMNLGLHDDRPASSCYIVSVSDSLASVFATLQCQVEIFRSGGGCGQNVSAIRSSRELLSTGVRAPGPVEFVSALAPISKVLRSGGRERSSSNIFLLDVDHPDLLDFIGMDERLPANCILSVRASDRFMRAAESRSARPWSATRVTDGSPVRLETASQILRRIATQMLSTGEPGIQFSDTVNDWHTCPSSGLIRGSNPCGEFLFLDDSAATLASVNLLKYFPDVFDYAIDALCHTIDLLVISLDLILGRNTYPSASIATTTLNHRPVLVGFSNLATCLMALGVPYDSEGGRLFCSCVANLITARAYRQSARMAQRLGAFPAFRENREAMLTVVARHRDSLLAIERDRELPKHFDAMIDAITRSALANWEGALADGSRWGFRNAQVTAIAPTGTISLVMDCDSTGIEPRLAFLEEKHLRNGLVLRSEMRSIRQILEALRRDDGTPCYSRRQIAEIIAGLRSASPDRCPLEGAHREVLDFAFGSGVTAAIPPSAHLGMVRSAAAHVSGGISKTLLVEDDDEPAVERVMNLLVEAWKSGIKGMTVYRVGARPDEPVRRGKGSGKGCS
jgi:ribonucleoside-diphosphate reductase alpha chain